MEYIEKELINLPKHFIVLVISNSANYQKNNLELIKTLLNEKKLVRYIYVTRGCDNISETMIANSIDISKLFFIDCGKSKAS